MSKVFQVELELLWSNKWIKQFVNINQAMMYYYHFTFYLTGFFCLYIFLENLCYEICVLIT